MMKILKKLSKISTISMILLITLSVVIVVLPVVSGQESLNPYPYINAVPNPVTVNTPTLFHVGSVYPTRRGTGQWAGLVVEIQDPNGATITLPPVDTDSTGGTGVPFTPTMVGTYKVRTHFPEQAKVFEDARSGPEGTIMEDSYSDWLDLVVQAEPILYWPTQSLPDRYWTRPIDQNVREWYTLGGNWIESAEPTATGPTSMAAAPNEYAPETGHVLFREALTMGGITGGLSGEHGFEQGDAYEGKFEGPVIIGGILFYNRFNIQSRSVDADLFQEVIAVDLHTGEELWCKPLIDPDGIHQSLDFGQTFYWDSYNTHGVFDYLWAVDGSSWHAFDPYTGVWVYSMTGVPSGARMRGSNDEIFIYNIDKDEGTISFWNSSRVISDHGSWGRTIGGDRIYAAEEGIEWTVTVPELPDLPGSVYKVRDGIILGTDFQRGATAPNPANMWCIAVDNLNPSFTELLWHKTWTPPSPTLTVEDVSLEEDLFIVSTKESCVTYGFRLSTGTELWGPTPQRHYTDNWGHSSGNSWDIILGGYNKVIAGNYGGQVWCYSAQTGDVEWVYNITDPYTEILHNNRWRFRPSFYTDGKLYIENTEHNPRDPQARGAPILCLDIETGELIWQLPYRQSEWSSTMIIGDSIIVAQNTYDCHLYAIGKGPSKTTVQTPLTALRLGESVIIQGSVLDISPGTSDPDIAIRFPNGVAAVSDDDMTDWMLHVYNQFEAPTDVEGVEVFIKVQDPNGEYYSATVTTDKNGMFSHMWAPGVVGEYHVTAMFEGTDSYYASEATTAFGVDATQATLEPEVDLSPVEDSISSLMTYVLVILVIVIIALLIAIYSLLKSRK